MDDSDDHDGGVLLGGGEESYYETKGKGPEGVVNSHATDNKRKREKQKANKKKKIKPRGSTETPCSPDEPVNEEISKMDPPLIADYVAQKLKRFSKDLSSVELFDRCIPESAFLDTTPFHFPRTLQNLPRFLETFSNFALLEAPELPGAPHTIIVTGSAVRAVDLCRAVRKYQTKESVVAKLFAKHIKLQDSIDLCASTRIVFGVGTPGRILHLIKEDILNISHLKHIVIDASRVDKKNFGVFDIRETQGSIMDILGQRGVKERLGKDTRVLFY